MRPHLKIFRETKIKVTCHSTQNQIIGSMLHIFFIQSTMQREGKNVFIDNFQKLKSDAAPEKMLG